MIKPSLDRHMTCICHMPELKEYPIAKGFTFYVMCKWYGISDTHDLTFLPTSIPFEGDHEIKYLLSLGSEDDSFRTELYIAFKNSTGEPALMLRRDYDSDELITESAGGVSYELAEFEFDVSEAVRNLPSLDHAACISYATEQ